MTASQPSSPGAAPISDDSQEPGLWLWQGEAPLESEAPPQSEAPTRPPSRVERIADLAGSAARRAGWLGPPSGWFLIGLAAFVMAHALSGGAPIPGNIPAAAPQPVPPAAAAAPHPMPSPSLALPASPAPVAARRKEGARFPPLPVDAGALPVSMRRLGGGNDMAWRRLLICYQRETLNPPAR